MKLYLAAPYAWKPEIRILVDWISRNTQHIVTSTWMYETYAKDVTLVQMTDADRASIAARDLEEVEGCETLVLFTVPESTPLPRGGRHFESGYALAQGKALWVVGPRENLFHYLPEVRVLGSKEELMDALCESC